MAGEHAALAWVETTYPMASGAMKSMLIMAYGAGVDAGLAEAEEEIRKVLDDGG